MINSLKFYYFFTNILPQFLCTYHKKFVFFHLIWLDHVDNAISNEECYSNDLLWAAYHANKAETNNVSRHVKFAKFPLFKEQDHSPAIKKLSKSVIRQAVAVLSPNQVPVITLD